MRFIDLSTWDRAMHYQAFRNSVQPQYCVTFDLDITNFLPKIKAKGRKNTFAILRSSPPLICGRNTHREIS